MDPSAAAVEARFQRLSRWTGWMNLFVPFFGLGAVAIRRALPQDAQIAAFAVLLVAAYVCVAIILSKWRLINRYAGTSPRLDAAFAGAVAHWSRLRERRRFAALLALVGGIALAFTALGGLILVKGPNDGDKAVALAVLGGMLPPFYAATWLIVLMRRAVMRG